MLKLVEHPNAVLSTPAEGVIIFDSELRHFLDEMAVVMYLSRGVGLAAPQVGVSKRALLIDPSGGDEANKLQVLINPVVIWTSDEKQMGTEGCLSLPGVQLQVPRSVAVTVEYHDSTGQARRLECRDAWTARIIQHEIDHLNGYMMLDRVGPLARKLAMKGNK